MEYITVHKDMNSENKDIKLPKDIIKFIVLEKGKNLKT